MKDMSREKQIRRRRRVRAVIKGIATRPRMSVFRSHRHIWVQLIDDAAGKTLIAAGDLEVRKKGETRMEAAVRLGARISRVAQERGITTAVFDRGPYRYHGMVRAVCEAARKNGLRI